MLLEMSIVRRSESFIRNKQNWHRDSFLSYE